MAIATADENKKLYKFSNYLFCFKVEKKYDRILQEKNTIFYTFYIIFMYKVLYLNFDCPF